MSTRGGRRTGAALLALGLVVAGTAAGASGESVRSGKSAAPSFSMTPIIATLNRPVTTYRVLAFESDGDTLTYTWSWKVQHICGLFAYNGRMATWTHPDKNYVNPRGVPQPGDCPVAASLPATISVVVDDGHGSSLTAVYAGGSAAGAGSTAVATSATPVASASGPAGSPTSVAPGSSVVSPPESTSGAPSSVSTPPTSAVARSPAITSSSSGFPWVAVIVLGAVVLLGLGLVVSRIRARGHDPGDVG
jgi:hypothetical protein